MRLKSRVEKEKGRGFILWCCILVVCFLPRGAQLLGENPDLFGHGEDDKTCPE